MGELNLVMYAIRNANGFYFKSRGNYGGGIEWVSDINKARVYKTSGPARTIITWIYNDSDNFYVPELLKLNLSSVEIIDETERLSKLKGKQETAKALYLKNLAKNALEKAERELVIATYNLNKLKSK